MHFVRFPVPLWFLPAGSGTDIQKSAALNLNVSVSVAETSIAFTGTSTIERLVSAAYNISVSTQDVTSVQVDYSTNYRVSASATKSLTAYISATGITGPEKLFAVVSLTPVYVLQQSGQANKSVEASYNLSIAGASGSIASYLSVTGDYSLSVAPDISASASETFSVSAAYPISLSTMFVLGVTQGQVSKSVADAYPISLSATIRIVVDRGGGLVWSRKKKKRIPQKVGFPLRD